MARRLFILLIILTVGFFRSYAQFDDDFCNDIDDKKLIKSFQKGVQLLNDGKMNEAEVIFAKIIDEEPEFTEAWVASSEINYSKYKSAKDPKSQNNYYSRYVKCLESVAKLCPSYQNYEVCYTLGKIFFSHDKLDVAKGYLKTYIDNGKKGTKYYTDAESTYHYIEQYLNLIENPVPFEPVIVEGVSSAYDDYLPLISPDGSLALFTKAYMKKEINSIYGDRFVEEFTVSKASDDKGLIFSPGEPLPYPFNSGKNQGAASISIDNKTLFITICEFVSRDYDNCDIYMSTRVGDGWSELKSLGPNINGVKTWESQPSISADGKTLYFASIRESNIGFDPDNPTSDIYYSTKDEKGNWTKAKNLGSKINTPGNEKSPFIHSDSQTLYFSSDGHLGIGGYDIFFSKFRDGDWTKPVNIGYPINTKNNDLGFVVNTQGTKAYFASNKLNGKGGWDIYAIDLYKEARPEKVFLVKGQLVDDNGYALSDAKLEVKNTRTEEVSEGVVDAETGHYAVAVTAKNENDDFLMVVKKEDYSFSSTLIEPTEETFEKPIEVNFEVKPIEAGKSVQINDIYYATASYEINQKSYAVLNEFAEFLKSNPTVKVEIRGHTDNIGSAQTNITLSNRRAQAVYDYLLSKGVPKANVSYKGYGPNMPIADNRTEAGRAKNRRTEFYILSK
ncbi:MAG: OmpA family protein [Bacteroidales bacterium]|nr:OmpA family protein [Bacteroidales bacterium]